MCSSGENNYNLIQIYQVKISTDKDSLSYNNYVLLYIIIYSAHAHVSFLTLSANIKL